MFTVSQIRHMVAHNRLKGSHGCFAKCGADNFSVSIYIQKKLKGERNSKTRKIATVYKSSEDLKKDLKEVEQKAIQWNMLMDEGKDPKYVVNIDNSLKDTTTLNELLIRYEQSRNTFGTGNAKRTMSDRRNTIENVFSEWMKTDVKLITKQLIINKYDQYTNSNTKNVSQTKKGMRYLRSLMNYAKDKEDLIDKNPIDILKNQISLTPSEDKRFLYPTETKKLIRYLDSFLIHYAGDELIKEYDLPKDANYPYLLQTYNLIKLLLYSGLRLGECKDLKWEDVHLEGGAYSSVPYFNIKTSKQQQDFGIPITEKMIPIFDYQEMVQRIVNLADIDLYDEKKRNKTSYVFPSPSPHLHKENLTDAPMVNTKSGFNIINILMNDLEGTDKIQSKVLRDTFATTGYALKYNMDTISQITGHISSSQRNSGVATESYVSRQAEDHLPYFEKIHEAFNGTLITDNDVKERHDEISNSLPSMALKDIYKLHEKGLLSKKERDKYGITNMEEEKLIELKENISKGSEYSIGYLKDYELDYDIIKDKD